ncbi:hypothetical protein RHMOL_Rhmol12G0190400 [Rhododendron molle]|uniref:Uncharacterized protein n=1 Tax=Rhododendron molle TaxID=49168 RepID=A0ACC0LKA7_RHOML|nr:hypothetical protein RHMOL_Rhmol12G0190400 [Rhododendron molle]
MGVASKSGEWAFKAFTAGLGVATIYLAATFSVNVYRGLSWHNAQSVVFGYREVMAHWYIRRSGLFSSRKELVEAARMPH